ncbi:MAG: protein translocase subunit SecF [Myxococcales bacterium]
MNFHFLEILPSVPKIDFVKYRKYFVAGSLIINLGVLARSLPFVAGGLNFGVDFAGGTEIQVHFASKPNLGKVDEALKKAGFGSETAQSYGPPAENAYIIRVGRIALMNPQDAERAKSALAQAVGAGDLKEFHFDPEVGDKIDLTFDKQVPDAQVKEVLSGAGIQVSAIRPLVAKPGDYEETVITQGISDKVGAALQGAFGPAKWNADKTALESGVSVDRVEYVGPQVGRQLQIQGLKALLYAMAMIVVYVGLRFDFRFAPGVVIALVHDAIVTLGYFAFLGREFNLTSLAAVLTVIGYSVNDTVVVYDRMRENQHKFRGRDLPSIVNLSINEMLARTILTSGVTALSLVGLIVYARGTAVWDFAVAMLVGIISGTYSTWYIASPMTIWLDEILSKRAGKKTPQKAKEPSSQARAAAS